MQTNIIGTQAPEFPKGLVWLNSGALKIEGLKGKLVLLEFWTYTCVNCLRVLSYLKFWHDKYKDLGLVVIGIHSPEFPFEKDQKNVVEALARLGITFPVALDPDHKVWDLWANQWWPRKLLLNSKSSVAYEHIGEGGYRETEEVIQRLMRTDLHWPAAKIPKPDEPRDVAGLPVSSEGGICYPTTPETYLGYKRLGSGSEELVHDKAVLYKSVTVPEPHHWYLEGWWDSQPEYIEHSAPVPNYTDFLLLSFSSLSVNCVMESATGQPIACVIKYMDRALWPDMKGDDVEITFDGRSVVTVRESRMYNIIRSEGLLGGNLKIYSKDKGLRMYAFTFGGCPESPLAR